MVERELTEDTAFAENRLRAFGVEPLVHPIHLDPKPEEIAGAAAAASQADQVILFLFDAHIYPSNKQLLDAVQTSSKRLAVILLRDVYDAEFIRDGVLCVTGYGVRICEIDSALRKVFLLETPSPLRGEGRDGGEFPPTSVLPH